MSSGWVRRVLVVEDQAALRLLVCEMLAQRGWETAAAAGRGEPHDAASLPPPPRESISTSRYFPAVR
ncbi:MULTISPECIES: response regulator [Microbacterium]|uniref:response regulator n=1 Tax=Microbacterium TaxID=33882 RepID=UPI001E2A57EB|nr:MULTISPECIES: response regulator [Microbacterium]MCC9054950.1 response regulator [Microbacterium sp. F2E]HOQ22526.1 response regulator [Microbacterium sp.]